MKVKNAMLPVYRKELRKALLEYLTWMHDFKKVHIFREIMDTNNLLILRVSTGKRLWK